MHCPLALSIESRKTFSWKRLDRESNPGPPGDRQECYPPPPRINLLFYSSKLKECINHRDRSIHVERDCQAKLGNACTRIGVQHQRKLSWNILVWKNLFLLSPNAKLSQLLLGPLFTKSCRAIFAWCSQHGLSTWILLSLWFHQMQGQIFCRAFWYTLV